MDGTWTQLDDLPVIENPDGSHIPYSPLYHASAVLPDTSVVFLGGEYDGPNYVSNEDSNAAIYYPDSNEWYLIPSPLARNQGGDVASVVLANGTMMIQAPYSKQSFFFDPVNVFWTVNPHWASATKADWGYEEGLTLLPDETVLTVNCYNGPYIDYYPVDPTGSEIFHPSNQSWTYAGSTIVTLIDNTTRENGINLSFFFTILIWLNRPRSPST